MIDINQLTMIDINKLKKIPPIDNKAPVFQKSDVPWSIVFEAVAREFERDHKPDFGICNVIYRMEWVGLVQRSNMMDYINDIIGQQMYVSDWIAKHNYGPRPFRHELFEYRAAWARHLAAQFRSKGL